MRNDGNKMQIKSTKHNTSKLTKMIVEIYKRDKNVSTTKNTLKHKNGSDIWNFGQTCLKDR